MSWPLFRVNIRANRFILVLMTAILVFYLLIIISMYDPEGVDAFNEMLDMMPETLLNAFGMTQFGTTLLTFISSYIYGMLIFLFPMVASIVINHRLVGKHVDRGSMAYLLSTPNSRKKIALTQALFSLTSITVLFLVATLLAVLMSQAMFPGELEIGMFLLLNFYALLTYYVLGGISFFASCVANEAKHSLGIGAGLPIAFFVLQMLGNATDKMNWIANLSLLALFDPDKLIAGDGFVSIAMAILVLLAVVLYGAAITLFNKRSLPL